MNLTLRLKNWICFLIHGFCLYGFLYFLTDLYLTQNNLSCKIYYILYIVEHTCLSDIVLILIQTKNIVLLNKLFMYIDYKLLQNYYIMYCYITDDYCYYYCVVKYTTMIDMILKFRLNKSHNQFQHKHFSLNMLGNVEIVLKLYDLNSYLEIYTYSTLNNRIYSTVGINDTSINKTNELCHCLDTPIHLLQSITRLTYYSFYLLPLYLTVFFYYWKASVLLLYERLSLFSTLHKLNFMYGNNYATFIKIGIHLLFNLNTRFTIISLTTTFLSSYIINIYCLSIIYLRVCMNLCINQLSILYIIEELVCIYLLTICKVYNLTCHRTAIGVSLAREYFIFLFCFFNLNKNDE